MKCPATTQLMAEVTARGIELSVTGETLRYRPRASMTPELLALLEERKSEVLARLRCDDEFTRTVLDVFGGEVVEPLESCPLDPEPDDPGTPPQRACNGCAGHGFHKVDGGPEWICDTCHPGSGPGGWSETWSAPACSIFEAMHGREGQVERLDTDEAQPVEIEVVDEHVDRTYRIVLGHVIIEPCRKQSYLPAIGSYHKASHRRSPAAIHARRIA